MTKKSPNTIASACFIQEAIHTPARKEKDRGYSPRSQVADMAIRWLIIRLAGRLIIRFP